MFIGTSHFKDLNSAIRYYTPYGETVADVKNKISEGAIHIGPPICKPGEAATLDQDGRYIINLNPTVEEAKVETIHVENSALEILAKAEVTGNRVILIGKLDRKAYTAVNNLLTKIGGKWNKSAQAHVFKKDVEEMIEQIIQTGEYSNIKKDLQQFDTPAELADEAVALAEIGPGMTVYEPSCGVGDLVYAMRRRAFEVGSMHIFANEIDPERFEICRSKFFIAGGISNKDFLSIEPNPVFDRVVQNPPFSKQADIDHVNHAMHFLKEDGCLVSIMSASTLDRENRKGRAFREAMRDLNAVWRPIPAGAFASSGTQVRTVMLRVWKDGRRQQAA